MKRTSQKSSEVCLPHPRKEDSPNQQQTITIDKIFIPAKNQQGQVQPRNYFDEKQLEVLVASIKEEGLLQPIEVRKTNSEKYELVFGERRLLAVIKLGWETIPAIITSRSDKEARRIALVENITREQLNLFEEMEAILALMAKEIECTEEDIYHLLLRMKNVVQRNGVKLKDNVTLQMDNEKVQSVKSLFHMIGKNWYSFTCNQLRAWKLPEDIKVVLREGKLGYMAGSEIGKIKDDQLRKDFLSEVLDLRISHREIVKRVKKLKAAQKNQPAFDASSLKKRFYEVIKQSQNIEVWQSASKQAAFDKLLKQMENLLVAAEKESNQK